MIKLTVFALGCFLLCVGCGDIPIKQGTEKKTAKQKGHSIDDATFTKPVSFRAFLNHFIDTESMEEWPEEAQDPLVLNGAIFKDPEMEPTVSVTFTEIPSEYSGMIPVEKLKKLIPSAVETKTPRKAFRFYGFRKIKKQEYWLLSFFALKLRRWENNEYHGHPFLLATFDSKGKMIDAFVWWTIEDDDYQVWTEVDVEAETLMVGKKNDMYDDDLNEVWQKVVIGEDGNFEEVYSNFPEGMK